MATIPGTLAVGAVRHSERAAVVFGERSHSYSRDSTSAVNRAAHALGAAGLRKGDRMAADVRQQRPVHHRAVCGAASSGR